MKIELTENINRKNKVRYFRLVECMNQKITDFISRQTCASLACINEEGKPYCFCCFYAFDPEEGLLYFKSSAATIHARMLQKKPAVAGTIVPDKLEKVHVRGIQFEGIVIAADPLLSENAARIYYKKYPFARAISGELWIIRLQRIKYTDQRLGFGKKITWERNMPVENSSGRDER